MAAKILCGILYLRNFVFILGFNNFLSDLYWLQMAENSHL